MVNKSPTAVAAWEAGAKRPTAANVAQLALSLSVDPGFFAVRPDHVAASSTTPHFRSLRSTSQLARDQAFAYGQIAVDIAGPWNVTSSSPSQISRLPGRSITGDRNEQEAARRASAGRWPWPVDTWYASLRTTASSSSLARRRLPRSTPTPLQPTSSGGGPQPDQT